MGLAPSFFSRTPFLLAVLNWPHCLKSLARWGRFCVNRFPLYVLNALWEPARFMCGANLPMDVERESKKRQKRNAKEEQQ